MDTFLIIINVLIMVFLLFKERADTRRFNWIYDRLKKLCNER